MITVLIRQFRRLYKAYLTRRVRNTAKSCGDALRVHGWSRVNRATILGHKVSFNGMRVMGQGPVSIGDNFHSGKECVLITDYHNYKGNALPYDHTVIRKSINIGNNVWFGERVMVLGGVTIGEGAIIQAGSVVVKDIPKCAIAGGHPAQVFASRDLAHYEELKRKRRFFR